MVFVIKHIKEYFATKNVKILNLVLKFELIGVDVSLGERKC